MCLCRALTAQIEQKDSAISEAQHNGAKVQQQLPGTAESARGGLPKDTPEDLDRLVKEWIAKVQLLIHPMRQRAWPPRGYCMGCPACQIALGKE